MPKTILPRTDQAQFGTSGSQNALLSQLAKTGRMPPVQLVIKPLDNSGNVVLDRFLSYQFSSSMLIPVDTFTFNFAAPDGPPLNDVIKEGDIISLSANNVQLATGLIDQTEVETDAEFGEKAVITGRDLMGQLEDQDSISLDSKPLYANQLSVRNGVRALLGDTRITNIFVRNAPSSNYLLATEPGEKKLSSLQRFLEPLNCLAWMGPSGEIIIGKPNFEQAAKGTIILNKSRRQSNVLSMRCTRAAAQIANIIVPVWSGQETVTDRVGPQQRLYNAAPGPQRLFKLGHRLPQTVVVSAPNATDAQGLSDINALKAGGSNLLQSYAKREMARQNQRELIVQAVVPGHFNDLGEPFIVDTIYRVNYDRGSVDENMYLFQVDYVLDESGGQKTNLYFCRLGTIVSDVKAP